MAVLFHGDCLDVMPTLAPGSVDAIITDLPYGTTACKWDTIIPFEPMWQAVKHVLKPKGAFVTTASQPFTSALVMSNPKWFRYEWIWDKTRPSGFQIAKYQPMKRHENVLVFSGASPSWMPIKEKRDKPIRGRVSRQSESSPIKYSDGVVREYTHKNPQSIIVFQKQETGGYIHPTQKPVALYEYLIRTYTNEGDTVLDFTMGSGTTGVAAVQTGRNFIGIEKNAEYFAVAEKRIKQAEQQPALFYQLPKNTYPERDVQTPLLCDVMQ